MRYRCRRARARRWSRSGQRIRCTGREYGARAAAPRRSARGDPPGQRGIRAVKQCGRTRWRAGYCSPRNMELCLLGATRVDAPALHRSHQRNRHQLTSRKSSIRNVKPAWLWRRSHIRPTSVRARAGAGSPADHRYQSAYTVPSLAWPDAPLWTSAIPFVSRLSGGGGAVTQVSALDVQGIPRARCAGSGAQRAR